MAEIHEAIIRVINDCPAIGKDSRNEQQKFMYRGIDAVMNVFQPLFAKHGIFVVPEVLDSQREERHTQKGGSLIYSILKVKFTFYAKDGSSICAVVQGEGMDLADKSSNKAMSAAYKYALFQTFCIPTEEMKDPDADTPPPSKPKTYLCEECGTPFKAFEYNGRKYSAAAAYHAAQKKSDDGKARCKKCRELYEQAKIMKK